MSWPRGARIPPRNTWGDGEEAGPALAWYKLNRIDPKEEDGAILKSDAGAGDSTTEEKTEV